MPLCRGTAVVGYITLLGLFLAAGMEVTATIPPGLQVRWSPVQGSHFGAHTRRFGSARLLPDVSEDVPDWLTFYTTG